MNLYHSFVSEYGRLARAAREYPLGTAPDCPRPEIKPDAPVVMVFSPHPDDEVIIGGLALRLMREAGWRVINVAVTLGSNRARQSARWEELTNCCRCIGFDLVATAPTGLERVQVRNRENDRPHWAEATQTIVKILTQHQPRAILFPHDQDWNSTHVGTHWLVTDALRALPDFECYTAETEFWGQMDTPNLMVELSETHLADLITALTYHVEEVQRNPYHLSLPAWMIDNVRRGAELVGGQGGRSPDYLFATLYRLQKWANGQFQPLSHRGRNVGLQDRMESLFLPPAE